MLNYRNLILIFISLNLLLGCQKEVSQATTETSVDQAVKNSTALTTGTVIETIDASGYTYVQVAVNGEDIWLAGPKTTLTKGDSVNVDTSSPMNNFHSKTLNRDFPIIYFVNSFSGDAQQSNSPTTNLPAGHQPVGDTHTTKTSNITLTKPVKRAEGGHTIAEILSNKKELSGKVIKVRGKVTKFTADIMSKNWIHIIDGSNDGDLTIITDQIAEAGQMIMVEGTVLLDKDFGYGYFYELLIDNAKISIE